MFQCNYYVIIKIYNSNVIIIFEQISFFRKDSLRVTPNQLVVHGTQFGADIRPDVATFEEAVEMNWQRSYSEWPNKSFLLPRIFFRKIREHLPLEGIPLLPAVGERGKELEQLQKNVGIQNVEELKEEVFRRCETICMSSQKRKWQLFLIYNLKLNTTKSILLRTATMRDQLEIINKKFNLDVLIFSSSLHLFLLKFANDDLELAHSELMDGMRFISSMALKYIQNEKFAIHPFLFSKKAIDATNFKEVPIYCDVNNFITKLKATIETASNGQKEAFTNLVKEIAYVRTMKLEKKNEMYQLRPGKESPDEEILGISSELDQQRISLNPITLKNPEVVLKETNNRLYNLTPQQYDLLMSNDKTVLVLGAAGTGKTLITK